MTGGQFEHGRILRQTSHKIIPEHRDVANHAFRLQAGDLQAQYLVEQDLPLEAWVAHQTRNLLQDLLARLVVRVRLPGEDELDRLAGIVHELGERVDVLQHERRPFVSGEPPRETNRERVEAERPSKRSDKLRGLSPPLGDPGRPATGGLDKLHLERLVRLPQFTVVNGADRIPEARFARLTRPLGPEMAVVDLPHFGGQPRA